MLTKNQFSYVGGGCLIRPYGGGLSLGSRCLVAATGQTGLLIRASDVEQALRWLVRRGFFARRMWEMQLPQNGRMGASFSRRDQIKVTQKRAVVFLYTSYSLHNSLHTNDPIDNVTIRIVGYTIQYNWTIVEPFWHSDPRHSGDGGV
jgi:hypothetical protein